MASFGPSRGCTNGITSAALRLRNWITRASSADADASARTVSRLIQVEPACLIEVGAPIGAAEIGHVNRFARRRGVHEAVAAHVDGDVGGVLALLIEEQQVAAAQLVCGNPLRRAPQLFGAARHARAGAPKTV